MRSYRSEPSNGAELRATQGPVQGLTPVPSNGCGSAYPNPEAETAPSTSPVDAGLIITARIASALHDELDRLYDKLSPVISPAPASPSNDEEILKAVHCRGGSTVANRFNDVNMQLARVVDRINQLRALTEV